MQTIDIQNSSPTPSLILYKGTAKFTPDELERVVRRAGNTSSFDDRLRDAIVVHLTEHEVVRTHEVMACVLDLEGGSELLVWHFQCVAVSRFS